MSTADENAEAPQPAKGLVVDCTTGETHEVELTDEDVAELRKTSDD